MFRQPSLGLLICGCAHTKLPLRAPQGTLRSLQFEGHLKCPSKPHVRVPQDIREAFLKGTVTIREIINKIP